ncbi:hypothetical protein ACD578_08925 [Microvirga sp. RSM25]|uniref:hypothetical protein n=1 Tax=Microvirga sp. RSM25 TaxID=3273802 RepID=UPI00384AC026
MHITLSPLGRGRFRASIDGRVLAESRTPFFDAARFLLNEGVYPNEILTAFHEGSSVVAMRASIGKAAGLTVIENETRGPYLSIYRAHPSQDAVSHVTGRAQAAIVGRDGAFPLQTEISLPDAFADDHARA